MMETKNQKNVVKSILFEAIEENYCTYYVQKLLWQGSDVLGKNGKNESTFFVAAKFRALTAVLAILKFFLTKHSSR